MDTVAQSKHRKRMKRYKKRLAEAAESRGRRRHRCFTTRPRY